MNQNCYALVGAIIRMELDSLIRVHHFNTLSDNEQEIILDKFFKNEKWTLSDRILVNTLSRSLGWAQHIYEFCCAFIHLSPYHDWATTSNIPNLASEKRRLIVDEIHEQQNDSWGYDINLTINEDFCFDNLLLFAPSIFKKLKGNLECELDMSSISRNN